MSKKFAEELKTLRIKCLLSQKTFSERSGIPLSTIKMWEFGKAMPTVDNMRIIVNFFSSSGKIPKELRNIYNEQKGLPSKDRF